MRKAFTLIELVVAVALLGMMLSFASVIFKVSIGAHRTAVANAEIMQKLRAISDQLDADFKGLRKDGEIFVIWSAVPVDDANDGTIDRYERFDRIMFFANGDFQSYNKWPDESGDFLRGNVARITYILANKPNSANPGEPIRAERIRNPSERILARTQHILTSVPGLVDFIDPSFSATEEQLYKWHNMCEYDKTTMEQWKHVRFGSKEKAKILAFINDVRIGTYAFNSAGTTIDFADANSIQNILCQGVGEFKIQGWYDKEQRWIPEVDPDGDGDLKDTDFYGRGGVIDPDAGVPGVLYPYPNGRVVINKYDEYPSENVNEEHFNSIPGLGRALKFTFTLYDSKGILKGGRTFTHIVYLDN